MSAAAALSASAAKAAFVFTLSGAALVAKLAPILSPN